MRAHPPPQVHPQLRVRVRGRGAGRHPGRRDLSRESVALLDRPSRRGRAVRTRVRSARTDQHGRQAERARDRARAQRAALAMDARDRGSAAEWTGVVAPLPARDGALIETSRRPDRVVLAPAAVAAIAATFVLMGLIVGAYGPLLEHLTRRFGLSLPVAGATISVHFAGSLPGVLIAMRSFEMLSARLNVMIATAIVSTGLVVIAIAFVWPLFLAGVLVVGFGFGVLVLGLNQLVAYSESPRRTALLSALNGCYSAGAVAGPILVATFARE